MKKNVATLADETPKFVSNHSCFRLCASVVSAPWVPRSGNGKRLTLQKYKALQLDVALVAHLAANSLAVFDSKPTL